MINRLIVYIEDNQNDVLLLQHALDQTRHQGSLLHLATVPEARDYFQRNANAWEQPGLILVDSSDGKPIKR